MYIRKLAAAAGFACGAALAFAPLASADTASDAATGVDALLSGVAPADATSAFPNLAISFDGINLLEGTTTTATTTSGQFDLAIAEGAGASAYAGGGYGDTATAIGTNALAESGSKAANAATFNFDSATDIGSNAGITGQGAPDGAYAGGASLIGGTDAATASSNDTAQWIGNGGADAETLNPTYGNSGAFAGDSGLIGYGSTAGNGDTAYTSGNLNGFGLGSAAVGGNNDYAYGTGSETGTNEGAFAGFGNFNVATADNNYTTDGSGVSATFGNYNYALADGPANSTADAGGSGASLLGNGNIAEVLDPLNATSTTADSAVAGSSNTVAGSNDLAEVLLTQGNASATGGNYLYDIISLLGNYQSGAADTGTSTVTPITSVVSGEVASANAQFQLDAALAGVPSSDYSAGPQGFDVINAGDVSTVQGNGTTPFDYLIYGSNPTAAGLSSDPGAYDLMNGATVRFDDAYNVATYALLNNGALDTNAGDYFGSLPTGFATDTATQAFDSFYNTAIGDLSGFFQVNLSFLDLGTTLF